MDDAGKLKSIETIRSSSERRDPAGDRVVTYCHIGQQATVSISSRGISGTTRACTTDRSRTGAGTLTCRCEEVIRAPLGTSRSPRFPQRRRRGTPGLRRVTPPERQHRDRHRSGPLPPAAPNPRRASPSRVSRTRDRKPRNPRLPLPRGGAPRPNGSRPRSEIPAGTIVPETRGRDRFPAGGGRRARRRPEPRPPAY